MTVSFSDNTKNVPENWEQMLRARWPTAHYYSEPVADAFDIEALHRDVSTLPRALQALERGEIAWGTPRTFTPEELFAAITDPAAFAARYHPTVAEALAALERLETTLGVDGKIHDCLGGGGHPTPTLTLAALRVRIEQLADQAATTQQRATTAVKARRAAA